MFTPELGQFRALAESGAGNLIPVYREVATDLETPVSAYLKIARGRYSFLLESVEGGERMARYSFIGTDPYRVLRMGGSEPDGTGDPLVEIQRELEKWKPVDIPGLPRFRGGAVGYLGYDCIHYFEPRVPMAEGDPVAAPEAVFLFVDSLVIFDHVRHVAQIVVHSPVADGTTEDEIAKIYANATARIDEIAKRLGEPMPDRVADTISNKTAEITSNKSREKYYDMIRRAKKYVVDGDIIQVVPSRRLARPISAPPFALYRALRTVNPSPYMYYLHLDDVHVVGASPEMLVRVEDGMVDTHPIAGTRPRGATDQRDQELERELLSDEKERAEHVMLLDLGRNDIGRVSEPGSVQVTQMFEVERYSHVMHIVSHVTGRLREGMTCYDALRACFPAGTVSGAPKIRAMEIISELETERRGVYAGAVGYFDLAGNMDTAIGIRTMVIKDGIAYVQAGGGIVFDSDPESEFMETEHKAKGSLSAIAMAEDAD